MATNARNEGRCITFARVMDEGDRWEILTKGCTLLLWLGVSCGFIILLTTVVNSSNTTYIVCLNTIPDLPNKGIDIYLNEELYVSNLYFKQNYTLLKLVPGEISIRITLHGSKTVLHQLQAVLGANLYLLATYGSYKGGDVFFQPYHLIQSLPSNERGWVGVYNAVGGTDLTVTLDNEASVLPYARTRPLFLAPTTKPLIMNVQGPFHNVTTSINVLPKGITLVFIEGSLHDNFAIESYNIGLPLVSADDSDN
eukprot:TRINITY_DN3307_c0_g1_i1.p1 TRINITY_DN3307_c0_g1~~TRINITY_DN3307_c0_g1_i1.p1  ORF type:complete len:274 (+),score=29.02 TRINITY_DN3307_c0_g1_i1:64-822(+)